MKKFLVIILCLALCIAASGCGGAKKVEKAEVGDNVAFGSYEQDNNTSNGKEEITWRVLAKEDDKVLLISQQALDCKQFHNKAERVHWEGSDIRAWLNEEFIKEAFSEEEQKKLIAVETEKDTEDKVFLLSSDEAEKYFESDEDRQVIATDYAKEKGALVLEELGTSVWWLRTDGIVAASAARVVPAGKVYTNGQSVDSKEYTIRPAMWVSIEK